MLDHAEPRVGNKVATSAAAGSRLWFTQKPGGRVQHDHRGPNAAGQRVDSGKTRVSGSQMSVSLRGGGNRHLSRQLARAVDGYAYDRGQFSRFQVGRISRRMSLEDRFLIGSKPVFSALV